MASIRSRHRGKRIRHASNEVTSPHLVYRYYNGRLLLDHAIRQGELWISDGKVVSSFQGRADVGLDVEPDVEPDVEIDIRGALIAPGYIDLQINGGWGVDFSSQPESVDRVSKELPRSGVTAFLPTVVSLSQSSYLSILPQLQSWLGSTLGASVLGLHLEGPFFAQAGAHNSGWVKKSIPHIEAFYGDLRGVKIVTLAPELPGARKAIRLLRSRGIVVSAGHSNASEDEMKDGFEEGIQLATHLFNAMTPFHHRKPGMIGAILRNPEAYYSLIVDGIHVHETAVWSAWKMHPEGLILVTDAISALGAGYGRYSLGGTEVEVSDLGARIFGKETLAGSVLSMDQAVRNLRKILASSISETEATLAAIEAATLRPARLLGIEKRKGTLQKGADADFILLDDALNVTGCYVGGVQLYSL